MNQSKITIGSLMISFLLKLILNVPIMYLLKSIGVSSYYGPVITDMLSVGITLILVLIVLSKRFKFNYKDLVPFILKVLLGLVLMLLGLYLLKYVYFDYSTKLSSILTIVIYMIVGAFIYFFTTSRFKLLNEILGDNYLDKIKNKFKMRKGE